MTHAMPSELNNAKSYRFNKYVDRKFIIITLDIFYIVKPHMRGRGDYLKALRFTAEWRGPSRKYDVSFEIMYELALNHLNLAAM